MALLQKPSSEITVTYRLLLRKLIGNDGTNKELHRTVYHMIQLEGNKPEIKHGTE